MGLRARRVNFPQPTMATLCLTDDELQELTRKARPSAQRRVLDHMGIPYFLRTDGSVAVIRETLHVGKPTQEQRPRLRLP